MAVVIYQRVPASLSLEAGKIMNITSGIQFISEDVKVNRGVRSAPGGISRLRQGGVASYGAQWLREQWTKGSGSMFFSQRRAEIIRGVFDPDYWYALNATDDITTYSVPLIQEYTGSINGQYWVETIRPTYSKWKYASDSYDTPSGDGSELQPGPGWKGEVIDFAWCDKWLAQRCITFGLPITVKKSDARPIAVRLSGYIEARASADGNSSWFQVSTFEYFKRGAFDIEDKAYRPQGHWPQHDNRGVQIPGRSTSTWVHQEPVFLVRDLRDGAKWYNPDGCDTLMVKVVIPPSMGYLNSRNEWATVKHRVGVAVFVGKGPNG
jgi:hypothetical protein